MAALLTATISFNIAKEEIEHIAEKKLTSLREAKKESISNYLSQVKKQVVTYSNSRSIRNAAADFTSEFQSISTDMSNAPNGNELESKLASFYHNEFGERYQQRNSPANHDGEELLAGISNKARVMQYYYIADNPNPLGEKDTLTSLDFDSTYDRAHKKYHPEIRKYLQEFAYYDIFIIDAKTGHIVYSVFKELDYATSLLTGPYKNSGLADVFKEARQLNANDDTAFSAFKSYTPSYEDPASFIASPIQNESGETVAVLAFQMPIDNINTIMTHDHKWKDTGLGNSGETYLVSEGFKAQSLSRFLIEDPEHFASALLDSGIPAEEVDNITRKGTNIGFQTIKTPGVIAALKGETGFDHFSDYRDVPVLSAYTAIEFEGSTLALIAEIDEAEAYIFESKMIKSISFSVLIVTVIILGIVAVLAWRFSHSLALRLGKAVEASNAIAKGEKVSIATTTSQDEITDLMGAMDVMQTQLIGKFEDSARETSRVTSALKVANTNLMMADNNLDIIYLNEAAHKMFKHAESDLRTDLPNFNADKLLGVNIDTFHKKPSHQRQLLKQLTHTHEGVAKVGGRTFRIIANPVMDEHQDRIGTVVEWFDETDMLVQQAKEQTEAAENSRLKQALDNVSANVMVADADRNIVYMNRAVTGTLKEAEKDIQEVLPQFDSEQLIGHSIDMFHKDPSHQKNLLENLSGAHNANIRVGRRHMELAINSVQDDDGTRIGTVVEWKDHTEELIKREEELLISNENARLKEALENVSANVMVADADRNIVYMNPAVYSTLKHAESAIQSVLPQFNTNKLIGESIDQFHQNPNHQRNIIDTLTQEHIANIEVGGRNMELRVNPINNDAGERIGTVVEWFDRTNEIAIQQEVDGIVNAARAGDLSQRASLEGKEGFFKELSEGLNGILENTDNFISDMGSLFESMAEGNLSQTLPSTYQGDFDGITTNANATLNKLCSVLGDIMKISSSVNDSASEISQGSVDLSNRTESQASSLEETAASMEEITSTVKESKKNSEDANRDSIDAKIKAESGGQVVKQAVDAMKEISESSNKINDIISVIDEIAFQTNLLALNAAVEAARAGEHGRGFAVVAGEVRTLSQRSATAAKEIKDLIRDSVNKVDSGSTLVNQTGETLTQIVHSVEQVGRRIDSVNVAAKEQSNGIGQINQAIAQMDEMTQQNAALVEETAAASRSMSEQATKMQQLVRFFKTQ
jgi:methyl-accepting chemotaxis protein